VSLRADDNPGVPAERSPGFVVNAAIVAFWFAALRYGVGLLTSSPTVLYGLTAATLPFLLWSGLVRRT
jgi:hypothetical protein